MALKKSKYEIKLTDAHNLVSNNILINKMSIENLQLQQEYTRLQIDLSNITIDVAKKKVDLIHKLNEVLEKQLNEYCEIRQEECKYIYDDINELDTISYEQRDKIERLRQLHEKMCELSDKINAVRSHIPDTITVNNYTIRPQL